MDNSSSSLENLLKDTRNIKLPKKPHDGEYEDYNIKLDMYYEKRDSELHGCTDPECREDIARWAYLRYFPRYHSVTLYRKHLFALGTAMMETHIKKYPVFKDQIEACSYKEGYTSENLIEKYYECMKSTH